MFFHTCNLHQEQENFQRLLQGFFIEIFLKLPQVIFVTIHFPLHKAVFIRFVSKIYIKWIFGK